MRLLRNRIRHFAVSTDHLTAHSLVVKTFSFGIAFASHHLSDRSLRPDLEKLRKLLGGFEEFVDARMAEIKPQLDDAYRVVRCPSCLQAAITLGDDDPQCRFCGLRADGEQLAREWVDQFLGDRSPKEEIAEPRVVACPECGRDACVDMFYETEGNERHVCLACGEAGYYRPCSRCGCLHETNNPGVMCDDCWEHVQEVNG